MDVARADRLSMRPALVLLAIALVELLMPAFSAFLQRMPLKFTVLTDPGMRATRAWNARVLPASFLIGRDGRRLVLVDSRSRLVRDLNREEAEADRIVFRAEDTGLFSQSQDLVAVASPNLPVADGWERRTLLQISTRPYNWRDWFRSLGLAVDHDMAGPRFELFSMVAEAAVHGMGIGLVPQMLVEDELARPGDQHLGKYNGLGGKLEADEDVASGMRREIMEEAGVECLALELRGTISWPGFGKQGEDWFGFEAVRQLQGLPPEILLVPLKGLNRAFVLRGLEVARQGSGGAHGAAEGQVTCRPAVVVDARSSQRVRGECGAVLANAELHGLADPGETVVYSFVVTNTGNVTLSSVVNSQASMHLWNVLTLDYGWKILRQL